MAAAAKSTLLARLPALVAENKISELLRQARELELSALDEDSLTNDNLPLYGVQLLSNLILNELYVLLYALHTERHI
mgnify:FL=1